LSSSNVIPCIIFAFGSNTDFIVSNILLISVGVISGDATILTNAAFAPVASTSTNGLFNAL